MCVHDERKKKNDRQKKYASFISDCVRTRANERQSGKIPEDEYEQSSRNSSRKIEMIERKNHTQHMHCEW